MAFGSEKMDKWREVGNFLRGRGWIGSEKMGNVNGRTGFWGKGNDEWIEMSGDVCGNI
jgi:hypothetical protein